MKLTLERTKFLPDRTLGSLYLDGEYFCRTLEDKVRNKKIYGETAISAGEYAVEVNYSPKFKRQMPLVMDVPNFTGIRIHAGNTPADTLGCILVGEYIDKNDDLRNSRTYENKLTEILLKNKEKHLIKIIEINKKEVLSYNYEV